jgi:putative oxidoreductase
MIAPSTFLDRRNKMDAVLLIGRILFAFMFVMSGINHLVPKNTAAMTGYAQFKKVPAAKLSVQLSGVLLLLGGLSIILGVYADLGAIVMAALLVIMALKMHDFWAADATSKQTEMIAFMKNISMAGGALFLFAVAAQADSNIGPAITEGLFQIK